MTPNLKLCLNPAETITGFNYAFAAALLLKLKELNRVCRVYEKDDPGTAGSGRVTDVAASVINYLSQQVCFKQIDLGGINGGSRVEYADLNGIIKHAEEFLAIFIMEKE